MIEQKRLGDIATYINGFAFKPEDRGTVGLPIIRIQDLTGNAYDLGFYAGNYPERIEIKDGDVLISWSASLGVYVWDKGKALLNQHIFKVVFDKCEVNREYFVYAVRYKLKEMESKTHGATMKHIVKKDFDNTLIPFPTLEEQENIANLLDKISTIILVRQQQLQKLDELVKARFVEMFGMPVSNTKHWKTEKMNRVAPAVNYSGVFDDAVWLLNLDMVESQTGRILNHLIVSKSEIGNSTCAFDTSNVLYSKLRPYLNKVVIPDRCGFATSELVPLQPVKEKINREYLAFMLRSDEFVNTISEKVAGAKMPRVSMSDFRSFDVPIPPYELQMQFTDFIHQVDKSKLLQFFCFPI